MDQQAEGGKGQGAAVVVGDDVHGDQDTQDTLVQRDESTGKAGGEEGDPKDEAQLAERPDQLEDDTLAEQFESLAGITGSLGSEARASALQLGLVGGSDKPGDMTEDAALGRKIGLIQVYIETYQLDNASQVIEEIEETCRRIGGDLKVRVVQSKAFCRWKQGRQTEALELFHEQEKLIGTPSSALCQNIGHTYSSLGQLDMAEKYFLRSLDVSVEGDERSGTLYGLGLVKERRGNMEGALDTLQEALDGYMDVPEQPNSTSAKVHTSLGYVQEKLGKLELAADHFKQAIEIFKATVEPDCPLIATALASLAKIQIKQGQIGPALALLREACRMEIKKDAFSLNTVFELLNLIKDNAMMEDTGGPREGETQLQSLHRKFTKYAPLATTAAERVVDPKLGLLKSDVGSVAALQKACAELLMLAGKNPQAAVLLIRALDGFKKVKSIDCSVPIGACIQLLQITGQPSHERLSA